MRQAEQDSDPETGRRWLSAAAATRVITIVLWAAIATGPLLAGYTWLSGQSEPLAPVARTTTGPVRSGLGPSDFAVRFVTAWIEAGTGDDARLAAFLPNPPVIESTGTRRATGLHASSAAETAPGYWAVTVAGEVLELRPNGGWRRSPIRFWRVGVVAVGGPDTGGTARSGQAAYVVTGPPAEVAGPATADRPDLVYGPVVDGAPGEIGRTVTGFLLSYLTGQPGLDRYLAPGLAVAALKPSAYIDMRVKDIAATGGVDLAEPVQPAEGRRLGLLVTVVPATSAGPAPTLQYALTVAARSGRWEITGLENAPTLAHLQTGKTSKAVRPSATDR